ncbi:MAG: NUDIX domain-containing protein [Burkholderiales bacterium]|nr:NUDIX domain-containing protein [Burkholderiales bacterium]
MDLQALKDRYKQLLHKLAKEADLPLPENRIPLYLNTQHVGHLTKDDAKYLADIFHFFEVKPDGKKCTFKAEGSVQASRRLAAAAQVFKQKGRLEAWRDELLSVVALDDYDRKHPFASVERAFARPLALSTFAVHLNPFTPDGRLWVGQRAMTKKVCPGMWDNCAAGMVPRRESFITAMERESWEEAGIHLDQLEVDFIGHHRISRPVTEGWMTEHTFMFSTHVDDKFIPQNQDGEVQKFELLTPEELVDKAEKGMFTFESSLSVLLATATRLGMSPVLEEYLIENL